ncbi:MAG TPA: PQQ-dependent sugar dehydrogenase, partial [Bacillota bacterium]|nr:PQQ-dependent sugar dehydrogenase [Bacillota bacterium]
MKKNVKILLLMASVFLCQCTLSTKNNTQKKPDSNRFETEIVAENLNQPMAMDILSDGRVLFVEKGGAIKVFNPSTYEINTIADIPVNTRYNQPFTTSGSKYDADDGMHGVVIDPDFDLNNYIYLYYSPESEDPKSVIARYKWMGDSLDMDSKKILLEWKTQRERCCHLGGGMIFDQDGNLLVAVGGNSGFSIEDQYGDPRRTAGNTYDLRGSILRIHPESNGTYTIPEGNLFSKSMSKARPEIYIMGV